MPAAFDKCVKNGGKVRTIKISDTKFRHICILNGKTYHGYMKTKKKRKSK